MNPSHHPSEDILLAHAAGGLDEAYRVVVATHLAGCAACRGAVRAAERVGGDVLATLEAAPMRDDARARLMARLDEPEPAVVTPPPAPAGLPSTLAGYPAAIWKAAGPGLAVATLKRPAAGRAGLHLLRLEPGSKLAGHGHHGLELTAVLQGAFEDRHGTFAAGDVAENDEAHPHAPVAIGEETCISLIALNGRLDFRNWLARLVGRWRGF